MLAVLEGRAGWNRCRLFAMMLPLFAALGSDATVAEDQLKGGPTPSPPGAEVYFVDLTDGATVGTKFSVNFGLDRMGVAPAGSDRKDSGHHHLLIDTDLPPLDQPIPNDFNHLHFGAGQTEANLTLRPGEHTLQLLLADKDHIPHSPPVMSARIKVRVVSETTPAPSPPNAQSLTPSPPGAEVYFVALRDGATVQRRFRVRFGLRNMGIAPAGSDRENSGHHHLLIDAELPPLDQPVPNDFNHLHFGSGETETSLTLTPGEHTLQLLLADGEHVPHSPPIMSARIRVRVVDNVATPAPPAPPEPTPTHTHAPAPTPASPPALAPPPTPSPAPSPAPASTPPSPRSPTPSARRADRNLDRKPSPRGARAYFVGRRNGDRIPTTVTLRFGVDDMDIRPAGVTARDSGHYHLLIDSKLPPMDKPIPNDSNHLDFPDGQTRAKITLTPGEHTLQLLLGDDNHMQHDPPVMSAPLKVIVVEPRNRGYRDRDDAPRRDPPRNDSSRRGPSQDGPSQDGPSQDGPSRYGPSRYGPYEYGPSRYGPYRYGPDRYDRYRDWRRRRDYYPD